MFKCAHLALVLAAAFAPAAFAAPDGLLDPTFGQGGRQVVAFDLGGGNYDRSDGMAVLPDGSIVLAGRVDDAQGNGIGLARLTPDGQPDADFGQPWYRPQGLMFIEISDLAVQTNGRIVVTGRGFTNPQTANMIVCRFLPDGSPDDSFATTQPNPLAGTGCRLLSLEHEGYALSNATAMSLYPDDRIALTGYAWGNDYSHGAGLVVRLDAQGNLDTGFDGDGIRFLQSPEDSPYIYYLYDIALAPDGDLIVVGTGTGVDNNDNWHVFRLRGEDGGPDVSFWTTGHREIAIDLGYNKHDSASAVTVLTDGTILVGGRAQGPSGLDCPTLARLKPNGHFDPYLNGNGLFVDANACLDSLSISDMLVQSDGRIVLAGSWYVSSNYNFFATRILPQGGFDPGFGLYSASWFNFGPIYGLDKTLSISHRIASHAGRLLLAGQADSGGPGGYDFAIARLDNDLIYADDLE